MRKWQAMAFSLLAAAAGLAPAEATEDPIGDPVTRGGLEVAAVFLQPVEMDPPGMMRPAAESDIHLEADIHAAAGNPNGFAEGDWLPYLVVGYELIRLDSGERRRGLLMPMVASDGPHYGDNVKLMGMGSYRLVLSVAPPRSGHGDGHGVGHGAGQDGGFGRHVDRETGVAAWFEPFAAEFDFTYAGTGKKGAY